MAVTWPTAIQPMEVGPLEPMAPLQVVGQTGRTQTRATLWKAWTFSETYPAFKVRSTDGQALLAAIRHAWASGDEVLRTHPLHSLTLGGVTPGATVNGASQTGSTITIAATGTNPIYRRGDFVRFINRRDEYMVTADVNHTAGAASLTIFPPVPAGASPANGEQIQGDAVNARSLYFRLLEAPTIPEVQPSDYLLGLRLRWITSLVG